MTPREAGKVLAAKRAQKYGHKKLSRMSRRAAAWKTEVYGPSWPKLVRAGQRLVPLKNLPPLESE